VVQVVIDPADELTAYPDARDRCRALCSRAEPALKLVVTALDKQTRVARTGAFKVTTPSVAIDASASGKPPI
jgi:hypothetical protein